MAKTKAPVVKKEDTHEAIAEATSGEFPMAMYKGSGDGSVQMQTVKDDEAKEKAERDGWTDHPDDHEWNGDPVQRAQAPRAPARVVRKKPEPVKKGEKV